MVTTSAARDFAGGHLTFFLSDSEHFTFHLAYISTPAVATCVSVGARPCPAPPPPPRRQPTLLHPPGASPPLSPPASSSSSYPSSSLLHYYTTTPPLRLAPSPPDSPTDPAMTPSFLSPFTKSHRRTRANSTSSAHSTQSTTSLTQSSQLSQDTKAPKKKPSFLLLPPKPSSVSSGTSSFGTSTCSSYASSGPPTPSKCPSAGLVPPGSDVHQTRSKVGEIQVSGVKSLEAKRRAKKEEKRRREKDPVYQGLKSLGL